MVTAGPAVGGAVGGGAAASVNFSVRSAVSVMVPPVLAVSVQEAVSVIFTSCPVLTDAVTDVVLVVPSFGEKLTAPVGVHSHL